MESSEKIGPSVEKVDSWTDTTDRAEETMRILAEQQILASVRLKAQAERRNDVYYCTYIPTQLPSLVVETYKHEWRG